MNINIHFLFRSLARMTATAMLVVFCFSFTAESVLAQPATHDRVTLDNGTTTTADDFLLFPFVGGDTTTGMGLFAQNNNASMAFFRADAPSGSLSLTPNGVGIGLSGFDLAAPQNAQAALHVMGGGPGGPFQTTSAFPTARVLIEDRNTTTGSRELLRLASNGGAVLQFEDTSSGGGQYKVENVVGALEFASTDGTTGGIKFRISPDAGNNSLIVGDGVGIGTAFPEAALHVLAGPSGSPFMVPTLRLEATNNLPAATRSLVELVNNGPMIQQFIDTSSSEPSIYQISAAADRFGIQQFANNRAGMVMFADGAIRFVANQVPNFTVTGNGSLNVVGSAPGGGNMSVGLGANIGPTDGNLFVKRNITYGGELQGPSDVNSKENFEEIDTREILDKVKNLSITRWNYIKDEKKTSHVGPMSQDFRAAFKVGASEKHISMMDSDGVSLAAIKGLSLIVDEKEATIARQAEEIANLKAEHVRQSEAISELSENFDRLQAMVEESLSQ